MSVEQYQEAIRKTLDELSARAERWLEASELSQFAEHSPRYEAKAWGYAESCWVIRNELRLAGLAVPSPATADGKEGE